MRAASTYRKARRNRCLRELKTTWGPEFYYARAEEALTAQIVGKVTGEGE